MNEKNFFMTFPVLETNRLLLRKITEDDAVDFFGYYSDRQVTKHLDWYGPKSVEHAKEVIQAWNDSYEKRMVIPWGITLKSNAKLIGTIPYIPIRGSFEWTPLYPTAVGFELSRQYWHQGIMTEALQAVISFGFDKLGSHRIQAEVFPENIASLNLLKKKGFQVEGLLKKYMFHEETKVFKDVLVLALLNDSLNHIKS